MSKGKNKKNSSVSEKEIKDARKLAIKISEEAASKALDPEYVSKLMEKDSFLNKECEMPGMSGIKVKLKDILSMNKQAELEAAEELQARCLLEKFGLDKSDNDNDPYGDGEQCQLFGIEAMKLQAQTSRGMNYDQETNTKLSEWSKICYYGCLNEVKKHLACAKSPEEKKMLLEKRESMMRFCGIFHVIAGARGINPDPTERHVAIAEILIKEGARVNAKDAGGLTPLHHCLSQHGNSITLKIAQLLVDYGADVNATNRFGATPLFEPCMTLKYDFMEFLVCHGCNPNVIDSHGITCQRYAINNPKILATFSKGYRYQAKVDKLKLATKSTNSILKCSFCETVSADLKKCTACSLVAYCNKNCQREHWKSHKMKCNKDTNKVADLEQTTKVCSFCKTKDHVSLKKCSGCLSVDYCSPECQKKAWKTHKISCKETQLSNKQNHIVLVVHPVTDYYGKGEFTAYNEKSKSVKTILDSKNKYIGVERAMKIKVQVRIEFQGPTPTKPLTVYDKERTYQVSILPSDANFMKLFNMIVKQGYGGIKLYFTAVVKKNSDLHINVEKSYPETW